MVSAEQIRAAIKDIWQDGTVPVVFRLSQTSIFLEDIGFDKTVKALKKEALSKNLDFNGPDVAAIIAPIEKVLNATYGKAILKDVPDESDDEASSSSEADSDDDDDDDRDSEEAKVDVKTHRDDKEEQDSEMGEASEDEDETDSSDSESVAVASIAQSASLKRKRVASVSDSSSDEDSDEDSDSGSEIVVAPPAKKAKVTAKKAKVTAKKTSQAPADDSSDSGSEESSDSASGASDDAESEADSDSESEASSKEEVSSVNAKEVSSDSDSDSSSDSESDDDDDDEATPTSRKVQLQQQESDSGASSVTLAASPAKSEDNSGMHPARAQRMAPSPTIAKPKKTNLPFQRVSKSTVVNPRFASNAYVAYDYADRAHQDLVVTKGKGFTKEKNKKKRGSYRGGFIDTAPKGIQFED